MPIKPDDERDAVASAWARAGGEVERLGRFWAPPDFQRERVRLYGNDAFCLVLAQKLRLSLVSPPDSLLLHIGERMLKRRLRGMTLSATRNLVFPSFVKSAVPKIFRAAVYASRNEIEMATEGLEPSTLTLVSDAVTFDSEVRCWILDGQILSLAAYEGVLVSGALEFASEVAAHPLLPATYVLDIGFVRDRGWAVIEANAAWGAGLNCCEPHAAVSCLTRACSPTRDDP